MTKRYGLICAILGGVLAIKLAPYVLLSLFRWRATVFSAAEVSTELESLESFLGTLLPGDVELLYAESYPYDGSHHSWIVRSNSRPSVPHRGNSRAPHDGDDHTIVQSVAGWKRPKRPFREVTQFAWHRDGNDCDAQLIEAANGYYLDLEITRLRIGAPAKENGDYTD